MGLLYALHVEVNKGESTTEWEHAWIEVHGGSQGKTETKFYVYSFTESKM